jgi:outer membrane lipopolysaccharide assembly protein LptE/RlpB
MRIRRVFHRYLTISVLSLLAGCGYHFVGQGGGFPGDIQSLAIQTFENKTKEMTLHRVVTSAVRNEFVSRRDLRIVGVGEADAVLQGTITSFTTSSLAYDAEGRAIEYRVAINLDLKLVRRVDGTILWEVPNFAKTEEYRASTEVLTNEAQKNRAIRTLAEDLAEDCYFRLREDF